MTKLLPFLLLLLALLLGGTVWSGYRQDTVGERLFYEYFDAVPQTGYGADRATAPLRTATDTEASLLRQLINYHQGGDFAEALAASRALLESDPVSADPRPFLLGSTAAIEIGEYEVAEFLLREGTPVTAIAAAERDWYRALLQVRAGDFTAAEEILIKINPVSERVRDLQTALAEVKAG